MKKVGGFNLLEQILLIFCNHLCMGQLPASLVIKSDFDCDYKSSHILPGKEFNCPCVKVRA